jgi:transcriptional regulator with XRE-family HTH domain
VDEPIELGEVRRQIAAAIKRVRKEMRVSQEQLAARMAVSGPAVTQWESGANRFPLERIPHLARALGVDTDLLVYEMGLSDRLPRRPLEKVAADRVHADRLHSTLRHRTHSQPADDANHPDDPDSGTLIRSQGPRSGSHGERIAS